jgi:hypothetical protein
MFGLKKVNSEKIFEETIANIQKSITFVSCFSWY